SRLDGLALGHVLTGHRCILHDRELHRTIYSPGREAAIDDPALAAVLAERAAGPADGMMQRLVRGDAAGTRWR
ncbi:hypothetical protein, partial [Streptomyces hydrogenans]|uniref:hypothetical protein n=1 Tax=Streptomyces hydrogenans TaxID=1873719 RepID=UPI003820CAF3